MSNFGSCGRLGVSGAEYEGKFGVWIDGKLGFLKEIFGSFDGGVDGSFSFGSFGKDNVEN